jgi:hypothetical protein
MTWLTHLRLALGAWLLGARFVRQSEHERAITVLQDAHDRLWREMQQITALADRATLLACHVSKKLDAFEASPLELGLSARVCRLELAVLPAVGDMAPGEVVMTVDGGEA